MRRILEIAALGVTAICQVLAQVPAADSSVGYWAGQRGEALDLAMRAAGSAPPQIEAPFHPDPEWGREPVEELTDRRGRVILRGTWNYTHAGRPNAWSVVTRQNVDTRRMEPRRTPPWVPGHRPIWFGREIVIPKAWAGRRIALDFKQVNRTVLVFANGRPCGVVHLAGIADITDAVQPGERAKIMIWFQEAPQGRPHEVYAGIPSEVHLISYPPGARITDVYVQPSVRQRRITLDIEIADLEQEGPLEVRAQMVNAQGRVEREFASTVTARAALLQTLQVCWDWPDPVLWDIGKPHLYLLRLAVRGRGIDDNYPQEFGFREFWIDGRNFYLNGTEVHLRTAQANWLGSVANRYQVEGIEGTNPGADLRAYLDLIERYGVNFLHWTPAGAWPSFQYELATLASRRGILMAGQLPSVRRLENDEARQRFVRSVEFVVRRMRNFPAVVAWVSSGPPSMPAQDQNPYHIGRPRDLVGPPPEIFRLQKSVDPARPLYWHAFTHGDIMSANWYLCFIPMQEREDWVKIWTERGQVPYHGSEFGMPFNYTFMRKRTHEHNSADPIQEEPFIIEYAAGWFGPSVYEDLLQVEWRFACWSWNDTGNPNVPGAPLNSFKGAGMLIHNGWAENNLPILQRALDRWPERTWRAWRTYRFSMMPIPWWSDMTRGARAVKDGWFARTPEEFHPKHRSLMRANQPTLAWISGPRESFTRKDHSFWGGRPIPEKNLVLINDTRDPQPYAFEWRVVVGDQVVASGRFTGTLAISERKFETIQAALPRVGGKTDGFIEVSGWIGTVKHEDRFEFRVFPELPEARGTVRVYDPEGRTTNMLRRLGFDVIPWNGGPTDGLVVIGREALRRSGPPADLRDFVSRGGRLLIMAHHPDWVEQELGFRVAKFMSRAVFRVAAHHPVVAGLDDEDLRDWGGESTLIEAWPRNYRETADYGMPKYGWRTSNIGGLTSGAPEVPHHAGWRPILVCEFGLAYSPLMELDFGQGRVVWCSLDLEDYVPDEPVAVVLARRILAYAASAPLAPRLTTVTLGLDRGQRALLDRMGLVATASNTLPAPPALAVIGANARVTDAELEAFAAAGGRVFFLASEPGAPDRLGATFTEVREYDENPNLLWPHLYPDVFKLPRSPWVSRREKEGRDVPVPAWPELAGLTIADFHRRGFVNHVKIAGGAETAMLGWVGRRAIGRGTVIYCQVDPDALDTRKFPYLRFTAWRQTRILAQMLANAGAQFVLDQGLLSVQPPSAVSGGRVKGYYHPDYRTDHHRGDNPFRYWRW